MKNSLLKITKLSMALMGAALSFPAICDNTNNEKNTGSVEHKNLQLDLYLDFIRYNCHEKIGILPYILQNPDGVYLEIGTGGDPIAEILNKIPKTSRTTLIASDIEEGVLNALPLRHPELKEYINSVEGPVLKLQKLNAVDMSVFENNSLSGINASAILHEIISYAGGFVGVEKFFKEAFRTLKVGGVLAYRDPEGVSDKKAIVTVNLKNKSIKLFTHTFLYKFLSKEGSNLAKAGIKFKIYNPEEVLFNVYKKNDVTPTNLTYSQYLEVPSYDIDFSRSYKVTLPCGLYRELARHYLTYLHQCNPLIFVKCMPDLASESYIVGYLAHSTYSVFNNFLGETNGQMIDGKISAIKKMELEQAIAKKMQALEFGIPLHFSSKIKESQLRSLLKQYGFSPSSYMIALNNGDSLLDYRIFGIFYDEINQQFFDCFNGPVDKTEEEHAKWLKREGEEFYFYYSADELISNVAKITLTELPDEHGNKEMFVLCPLSEKHNKFIDRLCYTDILRSSLEVWDNLGYEIEVKDGKRVVHFSKMSLKEAIPVYKNIIKQSPLEYVCLQKVVNDFEMKA